MKIFLSVGTPKDADQEAFIELFENRLRRDGLDPRTVGRDYRTTERPIIQIRNLMNECEAVAVLALERTFIQLGVEKRGGTEEKPLRDIVLPTAWNQVKAALAYASDLPLLMVVQRGAKQEAFLEYGNDWYVHTIDCNEVSLNSYEFGALISDWKEKTKSRKALNATQLKSKKIDDLPIGEIFSRMTISAYASFFAILALIISAAFWLGSSELFR